VWLALRVLPARLARKWPITWAASDGMRLHGFLSLPANRVVELGSKVEI
jgi:hypothetical protein